MRVIVPIRKRWLEAEGESKIRAYSLRLVDSWRQEGAIPQLQVDDRPQGVMLHEKVVSPPCTQR